ncbi:hypothetical protein B4168_3295 [Anoxybacillus flavithermus]|nr:hypothetical protein B4168_3295 [Anoxybacillus flavithermus]OAO85135.1 hypothetical protein GT23_3189 [Parageobacillus thermoglucosidasius]
MRFTIPFPPHILNEQSFILYLKKYAVKIASVIKYKIYY